MKGACAPRLLLVLGALILLAAHCTVRAAQRSVSQETPVHVTGNDRRGCGGNEIRLRVADGQPAVRCVFLNGQGPFRFLIDTGSQANLITPGLVQSLGLKATFRSGLVSAAGRAVTKGIGGIDVSLGGMKVSGQVFLFFGVGKISSLDPGIQGVLGQAFLSHFDYLLDLRKNRLIFGEANQRGLRVPLLEVEGLPAVSTSLGLLILDSGAQQLTLYRVIAGGEQRTENTFTGPADATLQLAGALIVGSRKFQYGRAVIFPTTMQPTAAAGLMPVALFKSVYLSNSRRYIVFD
jgi:hypothetical protein